MRDVPRMLRRACTVLALLLGVLSVHGVLEVLDASGHAHPTAPASAVVDAITNGGDGHHDTSPAPACAECLMLAAMASVLAALSVVLTAGSASRRPGGRDGTRAGLVVWVVARRPPPTPALLQVSRC